jgi:hypothetical protein
MHLRYDEDFVEEAVRLCTAGHRKGIAPLQITRFNREREKLYEILDPDERNAAFFALHLEWFREWGLEKLLTEALNEFLSLPRSLNILAFRKSRGKNDEGAELYVNEAGDRSGVVAIRPERFAREAELNGFLRHELAHLHDMVDPAFGYLPELPTFVSSINQNRLVRERYRTLWDVSIDGRLTLAGKRTMTTRDQRWSEFTAVFSFWPDTRQQEVFELLWNNPAPIHQVLVDLVCDPRQLKTTAGPQPGGPCPLCGFPTFAWASVAYLTQSTMNAIRSEFPHWTPEQGACARCSEIYRVSRPQALSVV